MAPLVTVGLPFFDEERHLASAIRSVLRQTFSDFELILLDDGSRDRSREIAESFDDPRIVLVTDSVRRHLPARLNEIVRRARGKYVARMDADDVMHPTRLAKEVAVMASGQFDAVGTWAVLVDDDETPFSTAEAARLPASPRTALERGIMAHATMLARREWLAENVYDETLTRAEDRDLWCRTAATGRFFVIEEPLYVVRVSTRGGRFLESYLESQRQNRAIIRRYGSACAGSRRASTMWLASLGKSLVMRGAASAGLASRLVQRRGRVPSARERAMALEALSVASDHRA
ncbi:putative capsular polysaccharide biosynthesis protein,Glycosyl Transferase Family 2, YveT [Labilithrix luteola]|uniref:Putative capsular polysaccharide biosynthesis protein,Glycosyl Transferase Family 2, YveT n=1 Tax=Labilithrix luteola TaxID=1391654 RepID=A0A0K1Q500_9BACT|nr:glycosyltransferase family 2 protein [Labilithrix luteola]AKV00808.1 putative capsular polysaccharide biosynthesis protein,Glycosyl Transferase Family 2, YveT [Labilithrix luteola]